MGHGRIPVEGDAGEIAVLRKQKYHRRHGKRLNPYSTIGLDKFETVCAELSAKREHIARKTGVPEPMVRFVSSEKGWIPVVLGDRGREISRENSGGDAARHSILLPAENNNEETGGESRKKDEGNDSVGKSQSISISVLDERSNSQVIPWSQFLKRMALGVLGVNPMWVKFIISKASFLAALFRSPNTSQEAIAKQEHGGGRDPRPSDLTVSAPTSPLRAHEDPTDFSATTSPSAVKPKNIDPEHKHHQSEAKQYTRAVSMDNRPTRPESSDRFYRPAMAYDANLGATIMIITLLFFVFYGPLCAIFFTCACFFLFKMF